MPVRDLSGREPSYALQVETGLAYEFLISLTGVGSPAEHETYEGSPGLFENFRTETSEGLRDALARIGENAGKVWVNLIGLATQSPPAREVDALIRRVSELDPLDLRLYLLGYHVPHYKQSITPEVLRRAAEGDAQAQERLIGDRSYFGGDAEAALGSLLRLSPGETKDAALSAMRGWYEEVFHSRERDLEPVLLRDAEAKRRLMAMNPQGAVIEAASGVQFVPDPSIRRVYLIPQVTTRPWVWLAEHDDARLYCYPVADESLRSSEREEPPGRLVRLHKALGDEKRLRMLRALNTSSATLQELADRFALPKSTAHHHLAILRSAGLIRVSSDAEHRYSIRRDVVGEVSALLDGYLGQELRAAARASAVEGR